MSGEAEFDPVAEKDQAREYAKHTADILTPFYHRLVENGMDTETVKAVTVAYAQRIMLPRRK